MSNKLYWPVLFILSCERNKVDFVKWTIYTRTQSANCLDPYKNVLILLVYMGPKTFLLQDYTNSLVNTVLYGQILMPLQLMPLLSADQLKNCTAFLPLAIFSVFFRKSNKTKQQGLFWLPQCGPHKFGIHFS